MTVRGGAIALVALATFGCAGAERQPRPPATASITFADVAPIFHRSCAGCHRPDGVAPFPLLTYDDVRARVQDVADAVSSRFMPPWLPEPGHVSFHGERRLGDEDIARIREWVTNGTPEGDRSRVPRAPGLPSGWQLDALDPEPGYVGMEGGAAPDGHFVGWSPGRQPRPLPEGLAWEISEGTDLVLSRVRSRWCST